MIESVPKSLQTNIATSLRYMLDKNFKLKNFSFSSGGCINKTGVLETSEGNFFLKWNSISFFPDMFEKEKKGLDLLMNSENNLKIPKVITSGSNQTYIFLLLENIVPGKRVTNYWQNLGTGLAELHRNTQIEYGLDYDNYIGSLNQINTQKENWLEFFWESRIEYTFKRASDSGFFSKSDRVCLEKIFKHLEEVCPKNIEPSLIHGDLWSGNLLIDEEGNPCLIDPAVYYGFREIEIAFTELFGRYDEEFYQSYNQVWPLDEGYEERKDIWNLYPLLVHVNLFGSSYISSVKTILNKFR